MFGCEFGFRSTDSSSSFGRRPPPVRRRGGVSVDEENSRSTRHYVFRLLYVAMEATDNKQQQLILRLASPLERILFRRKLMNIYRTS